MGFPKAIVEGFTLNDHQARRDPGLFFNSSQRMTEVVYAQTLSTTASPNPS